MFSYQEYVETFQNSVITIACGITEKVKVFITETMVKVKTFDYNTIIINAVLYYSIADTNIRKIATHLYNNNRFIKDGVDNSAYFLKFAHANINNMDIEPLATNWICTSLLLKRDPYKYIGDSYSLIESYEYMNTNSVNPEKPDQFYIDNYKELYTCGKSVLNSHKYIEEALVTMKIGDKYIQHICFDNSKQTLAEDFSLPSRKLRYKFLSIEYTHPNMKKSVVLTLDENMYHENNEILSASFIMRLLKHQKEPFVFDENYALKIMDSNINNIVLKSNEYLILGKMEYTIGTK